MAEPIAAQGGLAALLQLADSALPIGRYVHSHGFESWLVEHPDADADALGDVVWSAVESVATLDAVVLRCALGEGALAGVLSLDRVLYGAKPVAEARLASQACGRQLAALGEALGSHGAVTDAYLAAVRSDETPACLAVVEARLLSSAGACAADAVTALLTSSAASLLSTAVRLARIGPRAAQVMLWQGHDQVARLTAKSLDTPLADLHAGAIQLEIHLMRHRRRGGNLFQT